MGPIRNGCNMNKAMERLSSTRIGLWEFLWKLLVVLFIIMPICVGGFFWIGVQSDALLNIHLLKFIMPFIGSAVGVLITAVLIMAGHK